VLLYYWEDREHQKGQIGIEEIRESKVFGDFMLGFLSDDIERAETENGILVPHVFIEVELLLMP
jgi:hypothetical protein